MAPYIRPAPVLHGANGERIQRVVEIGGQVRSPGGADRVVPQVAVLPRIADQVVQLAFGALILHAYGLVEDLAEYLLRQLHLLQAAGLSPDGARSGLRILVGWPKGLRFVVPIHHDELPDQTPSLLELIEEMPVEELVAVLARRPALFVDDGPMLAADLEELANVLDVVPDFGFVMHEFDLPTFQVLQLLILAGDRGSSDHPQMGLVSQSTVEPLLPSGTTFADLAPAIETLVALGLAWRAPGETLIVSEGIAATIVTPFSLGPLSATMFEMAEVRELWDIAKTLEADLASAKLGHLLGPVPDLGQRRDLAVEGVLRRWVAGFFAAPTLLRAVIGGASDETQALLKRTAHGHPIVQGDFDRWAQMALDQTSWEIASPAIGIGSTGLPPEEWLLQRGFLQMVDWDAAVLVREVALLERGGTPLDQLAQRPVAEPSGGVVDQEAVDAEGLGAAHSTIRRISELVERWGSAPPAALKAGGIGKRVLNAVAEEGGSSIHDAFFAVSLARSAGLVANSYATPTPTTTRKSTKSPKPSAQIVVTPDAGLWLQASAPYRWAHLAISWLRTGASLSAPHGGASSSGSPAMVALDPDPDIDPAAPRRRIVFLDTLASLPPGVGWSREELADEMLFVRPTSIDLSPSICARAKAYLLQWASEEPYGDDGEYGDEVVDERTQSRALMMATGDVLVSEAYQLGLVASGRLTALGEAVQRGNELLAVGETDASWAEFVARVAKTFEDSSPADTEHFAVQADHTIVAMGRLRPDLAQGLLAFADRESVGAADAFRITEATLGRAFDRGHTGPDIVTFIETHAVGVIPQNTRYLIADVERRHGHLRVHRGLCVVLADDPAVLADAASHRQLKKAALRVIAPTVAVSDAEPVALLQALRAAGFLPVDGDAQLESMPGAHGAGPVVRLGAGDERRGSGERVAAASPDLPPLPLLPKRLNPVGLDATSQMSEVSELLASQGLLGSFEAQLRGYVERLRTVSGLRA